MADFDKALARRWINKIQKSLLNAQLGKEENREAELAKAMGLTDLLYDVLHLDDGLEMISVNQTNQRRTKEWD